MLKLFLQPIATASIPKFDQGENHDSIDLQVKSLLYLFKRLKIHKLSSFLDRDTNTLKYVDNSSIEDELIFQKLDQMYNTKGFIDKITQDEYRIMVDFTKNKFRSWCFLSSLPSENLSRSIKSKSQNGSNLETSVGSAIKLNSEASLKSDVENQFPNFVDNRDQKVSKFNFILFPLSTSIDLMANILAQSDIYCEHFQTIDYQKRLDYALAGISRVIHDHRLDNKSKPILINENEKQLIIQNYLHKLAFDIQVNRIYNEHLKISSPTKPIVDSGFTSTPRLLKKKSQSLFELQSPTKSKELRPPSSPTKETRPSIASRPSSPTKESRSSTATSPTKESRPSTPVSRPASPVKVLRSKPSISKLQFEEMHISVTSSRISDSSDSSGRIYIERPDIYEKCKIAINHRLKLEKSKVIQLLTN